MKLKFRKQKGFTLIELLVAIMIFAIFITTLTSSYIDIARKQREANTVREIYSEIRYVFNILSEEIRSKTVDYACYPSPLLIVEDEEQGVSQKNIRFSNACNEVKSHQQGKFLALIDNEGINRTIFRVQEDFVTGNKFLEFYKEHFTGRTWEADQGFRLYKPIELKNVRLKGFSFEIAPLADPFDPENVACGPVQFQPSVSVNASIEGTEEQASRFHLDLQTSLSSRVYNLQTNI